MEAKSRKQRWMTVLLIGPATAVLLSTTIVPLIYSVVLSLQNYNLTDPFNRKFVGLYQFTRAFTDPRLWESIKVTFIIMAPSLILELTLGIMIAILLNKRTKGMNIVRSLILLPMMVTPVVVALVWGLIYNSNFGIINYFLSLIGLGPYEWLSYPFLARLSVIIVDVWQWTPFVILIILAGLQSLPPHAFKAARVDGASGRQVLRHITLPLLKPTIIVAAMFRLLMHLVVSFDIIYVLTGGGPGAATETLSMYIYKQGFVLCDVSYASALSYIFLVISILICQRLVKMTTAKVSANKVGGESR